MKEKSWWSNNGLAVTVALLVFCALTAGSIYSFKLVFGNVASQIKNYGESTSNGIRKNSENRDDAENPSRVAPVKADANSATGSPYGLYMAKLQRRIKACWYPPKGNETMRVTVFFKVDRQGQLHNLKVTPCGDPASDLAARKAVETAAPFDRLPAATTDKDVNIQFTFDYNVFNKASHRPTRANWGSLNGSGP